MKFKHNFFVRYSPEQINPDDKVHHVTNMLKITSGSMLGIGEFVDLIYKLVIEADTHKAQSLSLHPEIIAVAQNWFKEMTATEVHALGKSKHVLYNLKYLLNEENTSLHL